MRRSIQLSGAVLRLLPSGMLKAVQERLDSAGNPAHLSPLEFIGIRLAFAATCPEASLFRAITLNLQPAGP